LQRTLDDDSAFFAYLEGDTRGAVIWITHDSAKLIDADMPDDVRAATGALGELLRSVGSSVAEIDVAAQNLSTALLRGVPGVPPRRLYILADEATDGVAWSVLHWPGHREALLDSTAVSIVHVDGDPKALVVVAPALHVVIAAQKRESEQSLPTLSSASAEPREIGNAVAGANIQVDESATATRTAVLDMLGERGVWVHIAAHGTAQPQRVGYAGIWLEPTDQDTTPPFLSWLDVLDSGARADLVVLNACRLGDGGNVVGANMSFADALVRAGARHVVAAAWPVSDSASALWVPAFYSALVSDPRHDAAVALRAAQLRLRQSRAFTHPFFWASLQTLERLPVATTPQPSPAIARLH
jgi:hypothetical protein